MREPLAEDRRTMPQPFFGMQPFASKMLPVQTTHILEFDTFGQIPDSFVRIQLRCRSWQVLQMNPLGSAFAEVLFDWLTAMNGRSIPDHEPCARDLTGEHRQNASHVGPVGGMVLASHQERSFCGDTAQSRKVITRQFPLHIGVWPTGAEVRTSMGNRDKAD